MSSFSLWLQYYVVRLCARPQHCRMASGKLHLLHGQVGDDMVNNCTVGGLDPCSTQWGITLWQLVQRGVWTSGGRAHTLDLLPSKHLIQSCQPSPCQTPPSQTCHNQIIRFQLWEPANLILNNLTLSLANMHRWKLPYLQAPLPPFALYSIFAPKKFYPCVRGRFSYIFNVIPDSDFGHTDVEFDDCHFFKTIGWWLFFLGHHRFQWSFNGFQWFCHHWTINIA